jgi:phospholipase C
MPLLILSAYSTGGKIHHGYGDHVSLLRFIERNWRLAPITHRSCDNPPNPVTVWFNPYVPLNSPAITDLFEAFDFQHPGEYRLHRAVFIAGAALVVAPVAVLAQPWCRPGALVPVIT